MWVTFYPFSLNKKTIVGPTNRHKDLLKIVAVAIRRRKKFFFPFFFFLVSWCGLQNLISLPKN